MSPPALKKLLAVAALALVSAAALAWWRAQAPSRERETSAAPERNAAPPAPVATRTAVPPPAPEPPLPEDVASALQQADPRQRSRDFGLAFQRWVERDLEGALGYLRRMRRGAERSQALFMALDALSRRDLERALVEARELVINREDRAFYSALFHRLASENVQNAVAALDRVPEGEARENALRALTDAWTRQDPAAALEWARQLADPVDRSIAVETALLDLAAREPRLAVDLAQEMLRSPALDRVVTRAVQRITALDPAGASALVGTLPPGDAQTMAAMEVARALAAQDIESALAWAKTLHVELTQWLAINNILSLWAQKDPMAVARYVAEMPPGPGLDFIARHAAALLSTNPQDAILWAEALPTDSARSAALIMIASSWAQRAPAEAVRWAATLRGEPLRTEAISGAHSYWMLLDPSAARAWLETADLPAETKSKLLRSREVQF